MFREPSTSIYPGLSTDQHQAARYAQLESDLGIVTTRSDIPEYCRLRFNWRP